MKEILTAITRPRGARHSVYELILERASAVCEARGSALWRVDGNLSYLEAGWSRPDWLGQGAQAVAARRALFEERFAGAIPVAEQFLVRLALEAGKAVQVRDAADDPRAPGGNEAQRIAGYRTGMGVPLFFDGRALGVLVLTRDEVRPFTPHQVALATSFADQAAIAMQISALIGLATRQRDQLARFLSPQVAELVTSEAGRQLLEGHRREISVLFADLRGFTAFSESAEPEEVLGVLRRFHQQMGGLITEHGGTLEHFAGDGLMVFFNDPLELPQHELRAVRLGLAMHERFTTLSEEWRKKGYALGLGIGCAVGFATLGRIGFEGRYDYGAVGMVVNLAARLAAHAGAGELLVSQRLGAAVETAMDLAPVADAELKGFSHPVRLYRVIGESPTRDA